MDLECRSRVALALLLALGAAGCKSAVSTSDGRPMPPAPRQAAPAPSGARASAMAVVLANKAIDTDGNGYPDEIRAELHLFAEQHPSPVHQAGSLVFRLYPPGRSVAPDVVPLVEWRLEPERVQRARVRTLVGPGYAVQLSLLEKGGDQYPLMAANLTAAFEPADGGPMVQSSQAMAVTIGRR